MSIRGYFPSFHRPALFADARGTATIEFALVFPILLFLMLLLAQTTLLMSANQYAHYAALSATRSAIVQIPRDLPPEEPTNTIVLSRGYTKFDAIRMAAVYALVPVSGRSSQGMIDTDPYTRGLSDFFAAYNTPEPAWVDRLLADRLRYAYANTTVTLLRATVESPSGVRFDEMDMIGVFGPKDPITVRVEHRLALTIPYVGALFADGTGPDGRYTLVRAQYTLTNEGIDKNLPPAPEIPRNP